MKTTIDMAREAGFLLVEVHDRGIKGWWECFDDELETLVALVRADEREACAVLAQQTICDTHIPTGINIYGTRAAKAIRARGNT